MQHSVPLRHGSGVARAAALAIMAIALLVAAAPAMADQPVRCTGALPPGTYGNVIVPSGSTCSITGSNITGNVVAQSGARSLNVMFSTIAGNYVAHSAYAGLCCSTVEGNVTITAATNATQIYGSTIHGNADMVNNDGGYAWINANNILGNVNFTNNVSTSRFGNLVNNNTIERNLICENNSPPPTNGANTVGGNANGQCSTG